MQCAPIHEMAYVDTRASTNSYLDARDSGAYQRSFLGWDSGFELYIVS